MVQLFRPFALFLIVAGAQLVINDSFALETSGLGTDAPKLQVSGVELNSKACPVRSTTLRRADKDSRLKFFRIW